MTFDLSGVWYRVYTEVPFFLLLGIIIVAIQINSIRDKRKKRQKADWQNIAELVIGVVGIIGAILLLTNLLHTIYSPDIKSINGVFVEEYRDSTVAKALPFTNGYAFREVGRSNSTIVYLDSFSAKDIIGEDLVEGKLYTVWYETENNIIVCLRPGSNTEN